MKNDVKTKIRNNRITYDKLKTNALNEQDIDKKIEKIKLCASWAVNLHTGLFSDRELENELIQISKTLQLKLHTYQKNTVLHIMTKSGEHGGHSRYIDNWLRSSKRKTALCLTEQKISDLPSYLDTTINELDIDTYSLKQENILLRAMELRKLASQFEYIVLSIHMNDILPILAFGTEDFERPVMLLNHADHIYWLGLSISDMIIELSSDGSLFTKTHRGYTGKSYVLPIPIDDCRAHKNINFLQKFGIDDNVSLVVSMASPHKYKTNAASHFSLLCKSIVEENRNTYFIVIGPSLEEPEWKQIYEETNGLVIAAGILKKQEVLGIISQTSLYLDSFPLRSYTSLLEFSACGVPCLSLKSERATIDALKLNSVAMEDIAQLKKVSKSILSSDKPYNKELINYIHTNHLLSHGWHKKVEELFLDIECKHTIDLNFISKRNIDSNDELVFLAQEKVFLLFSSLLPLNSIRIKLLIKLFYLKPSLMLTFFSGLKKKIKQVIK